MSIAGVHRSRVLSAAAGGNVNTYHAWVYVWHVEMLKSDDSVGSLLFNPYKFLNTTTVEFRENKVAAFLNIARQNLVYSYRSKLCAVPEELMKHNPPWALPVDDALSHLTLCTVCEERIEQTDALTKILRLGLR